jgi:hypothetical protein
VLATLVAIKLAGSTANSNGQAAPTPTSTATFGFPNKPPVFTAAQPLDVVVEGNNEWELTGSALSLLHGGEVVATRSLTDVHLPGSSTPLLALDSERDVIWVVVANAVPTRMIEYDTRTLRPLVKVDWAQLVYGAAAVNGYLYLANDLGVAEVSPYTLHPRFVAGLRGALGPIAADPVNHQLIAVDVSNPMEVYSYRHGRSPYEAALRLPMGKGTVAVADGHIWVGGYGARGAMLYRLDPHSLRPVYGGRAVEFDPGAVLMAAGSDVVWVRTGDPSSDLFACVDAATGRIEQRFHLSGVQRVASTAGAGVVATDQGVLPLTMGDCTG